MSEKTKSKEAEVSRRELSACLELLREARATILADSEAFNDAARILERVGQIHGKKLHSGLSLYGTTLLQLGSHANVEPAKLSRLFELVVGARNSAVHVGAWARQTNNRLVEFIFHLEESIITQLNTVEDIMVRNPTVAEPWHLVGDLRRTMLSHSFSYLPIWHSGQWHLISDGAVMRFLRSKNHGNINKELVMKRTAEAIALGLDLIEAQTCHPEYSLSAVAEKISVTPILVVEKSFQERLCGIVTTFDLL